MPVISMMLGAGQMDQAQKKQFIENVTQMAADITQIPEEAFIVSIEELSTDNIGVGGETLTDRFAARLSSD